MDSDQKYEDYPVFIKVREGFIFKNFMEFCHASLEVLVFKITNTGLHMSADNRTENQKETLLCKLIIPRQNCEIFEIPTNIDEDDDAELIIPVDASNLRTLTSGILKKDLVLFYIRHDDIKTLQLETQNLEKERNSKGSVKLINIDDLSENSLHPVSPCEYNMKKPNANVLATEFQKACKAGTQLKAKEVRIIAQEKSCTMYVSNAEVSRNFPFGREVEGAPVTYDREFTVKDNIGALPKCCPMTTYVRIYCSEKKPMLVSFDAGKTGKFDVYLVPKV